MSLLQEFAKEWLQVADTGVDSERFVNIKKYGLCINYGKFVNWDEQYAIQETLKYWYQNCDHPFDDNRALYMDDNNKHLNPKRRAFVEAIAQGKLVVDDFGDVVIVRE